MFRQLLGFLGWFLITFLAAGLGAWGSASAPSFYQSLSLPSWAPPASVFGPVWSVLYVLMAMAVWLVWRERGWLGTARIALGLYLMQLALNALWSWAFFTWHQGGLAFAVIILLWFLILATLISFWRINKLAGALLVPYLAWVSFAAVLNFTVWQLNPSLL
ncbi:TspO/MBR family protein [uncultured Thiothrix sp.]|uniref:TspO/MBR family protein n=1 Tax=uncultured Thiothrix sp. TaxID=223185 RepID=UPI00260AB1FD|nr:TspO/MBR family protein [uncultured Thiothrix sp.]